MIVDDRKDLLPKKGSIIIWAIVLLVYLTSCGSDLVAPKYEDEENPDKPVGEEDPIGIN